MIFETKRLYVRELKLDDIRPFNEMQSNINVMRYVTGKPKSKFENIKELERIVNRYEYLSTDLWIIGIIRKYDDQLIGTCGVIRNKDEEYEIGYRFIERFWDNGYGKEILEKLIEYCFESIKLNKIVAYVEKANAASVKILDNSKMELIDEYIYEGSGKLERRYKLHKNQYFSNEDLSTVE